MFVTNCGVEDWESVEIHFPVLRVLVKYVELSLECKKLKPYWIVGRKPVLMFDWFTVFSAVCKWTRTCLLCTALNYKAVGLTGRG